MSGKSCGVLVAQVFLVWSNCVQVVLLSLSVTPRVAINGRSRLLTVGPHTGRPQRCIHFWGWHLRAWCCPCIIERSLSRYHLIFVVRTLMYQIWTLNCNILTFRAFKFSLYMCALVYSCFVKNPSTWSWRLTCLIRWGCHSWYQSQCRA
jgi:hypothetical protein